MRRTTGDLRPRLLLATAAVAVTLGLGACGDDGAGVREGGTSSETGTGSQGGTGSETGTSSP